MLASFGSTKICTSKPARQHFKASLLIGIGAASLYKDKSLSLQDTIIEAKDKEIEILKGKLADVQSQLDYANRSIWAKIGDVFLFRN
ncbi:MAG: hypothetical protein QGG39_19275 [Candidatus Poribacteria bacterium]|nr:hypothetical protein [Candidatus Poribacteria bacterium]